MLRGPKRDALCLARREDKRISVRLARFLELKGRMKFKLKCSVCGVRAADSLHLAGQECIYVALVLWATPAAPLLERVTFYFVATFAFQLSFAANSEGEINNYHYARATNWSNGKAKLCSGGGIVFAGSS